MDENKKISDIFNDFYSQSHILLQAKVLHLKINKNTNSVNIDLHLEEPIDINYFLELEEFLKQRFKLSKVYIKNSISNKSKINLSEMYEQIKTYTNSKSKMYGAILLNSEIKEDNNKLIILLKTKSKYFLDKKGFTNSLEKLIENYYDLSYKVIFDDSNAIVDSKVLEEKNNSEIATNFKEETKKETKELDNEAHIILGSKRAILRKIEKIDNIVTDMDNVAIFGHVSRVKDEIIEIKKNNRCIVSFDVYDKTNTINCKCFVDKDKAKKVKDRLKKSSGVKLDGKASFDKYSKEITIVAFNIIEEEFLLKKERQDTSDIKRVELHLHTKMSQMDGVSSATSLINRAIKWGMKSIAITDHGVVQSFPEVYHLVEKNPSIKIIYGVEAYLIPDVGLENEGSKELKKEKSYHAIILAKNQKGLKNLYKLISISHLDYFYRKPKILRSIYNKYQEGLILGSACEAGELYRAIVNKLPENKIIDIAKTYDYLEIQPIDNNMYMVRNGTYKDRKDLEDINKYICELGEKLAKPVVATCDVHFLDPEDEIYRRILMASQGYDDADNQAPLYLRTTEEMLEEFMYLGKEKAYEVVVTNTNKVADMIEEVKPISPEKCPPHLPNCEKDIQELAYTRAYELYGNPLPEIVKERLDKELNSIISNGFSVMYIIAHKLVKKSNDDGYLVGSRGSVGSSLAAYMTGITEVNSLIPHYRCAKCKYSDFSDYGVKNGFDLPDKVCPQCGEQLIKDGMDIPFETFLGFNGDKEPDIDLNFSGEYQAKAHKYTEVIFGKGTTFKAGTIGSIQQKTAETFVRKYFEEKNQIVSNSEISRIAVGLIDVKRSTGQHPGGIIVVPKGREIIEFCPVQHPADDPYSDIITTHFDYHSIDKNLLKLDILGHDDPTMIRKLQDLTGIDPKTINMDDKETMKLFSSTTSLGITQEQINSEVGTFGVPEFGTKFVRGMLIDTKPKTFEELIRISGLSHGENVWLNNAQTLINNKTATLSETICTRDDIMTYLINKGLEPNDAFKIMESVRKGKVAKGGEPKWETYKEIMRQNNVPEWYIASCEKIKYMFPKAHAVAYVIMAFRIGWYKVHYPLEYYTAFFSIRASQFDYDIMCKGKEKVKNKMKEIELSRKKFISKR